VPTHGRNSWCSSRGYFPFAAEQSAPGLDDRGWSAAASRADNIVAPSPSFVLLLQVPGSGSISWPALITRDRPGPGLLSGLRFAQPVWLRRPRAPTFALLGQVGSPQRRLRLPEMPPHVSVSRECAPRSSPGNPPAPLQRVVVRGAA